jgi:hypothetical protein
MSKFICLPNGDAVDPEHVRGVIAVQTGRPPGTCTPGPIVKVAISDAVSSFHECRSDEEARDIRDAIIDQVERALGPPPQPPGFAWRSVPASVTDLPLKSPLLVVVGNGVSETEVAWAPYLIFVEENGTFSDQDGVMIGDLRFDDVGWWMPVEALLETIPENFEA